MAIADQHGYAILREEFGLLHHSIHQSKVQSSINFGVVADTSSGDPVNALERQHNGQVPASGGAHVLRFQEGRSFLGDYTNSLCLEQNHSAGDQQNGQGSGGVDGFPLQMYSAGSDWPGGIFVATALMPTETTRESISEPHIPNYLALSVVVTLLFFAPIGAFAILYAVQAKTLKKSGFYTKAKEKATQALHLNFLAIAMGVICFVTTALLVWYNIKRRERLSAH